MGAASLDFAVSSLSAGAGGIAELSRQVLGVLLELARSGSIKLKVFVLDDPGPAEGDGLFGLPGLPEIKWYGGSRWRFSLGLLMSRADVTLYDHVGLARLQGWLPAAWPGPYLLLIHSVEIWNNHRPDYHRTARKAGLLIANSSYTARKARDHYADLPGIRVCWPGKSAFPAENAGDAAAPGFGPHAMLIVGRLDGSQRHKGHDQLIDAMPMILERIPDARLVVAGGGDDRDRLEARARKNGVAGQVVFLGYVDQEALRGLYGSCALFVMPSEGDGFGLVFLEAMMHKLPCVGLAGGAAAEIFDDGRYGLLVDRDNLPEMARALAGLLADEQGRARLGAAGFERYREQFTARKHAERLKRILEDYVGTEA